jgi:hypothetical protein
MELADRAGETSRPHCFDRSRLADLARRRSEPIDLVEAGGDDCLDIALERCPQFLAGSHLVPALVEGTLHQRRPLVDPRGQQLLGGRDGQSAAGDGIAQDRILEYADSF